MKQRCYNEMVNELPPTLNFVCGQCSSHQEVPVDQVSFGFSSDYCPEHGSHYAIDLLATCGSCEARNLFNLRDDEQDDA